MNLPPAYKEKKYALAELIAAGIVLVLLIILLTSRYVHFDWVTDTIWLAAATVLILPDITSGNKAAKLPGWIIFPATGLLCALYLFLFHLLAVIISLSYTAGFEILLYLAACGLFGYGLYMRARNQDIILDKFNWKNLLRYPHWPLAAGTTLCLLAMFFHMSRISSLQSSYGLQFNYNAYSGWGYNSYGYNYYGITVGIRGWQTHFGIFATLLAAFMLVFHIVQAVAKKTYPKLNMFYKAAVPVLLLWWLAGAKGYDALKGFGNILFLPGIALSALAIYLPQQLGEWIKKKGLIP